MAQSLAEPPDVLHLWAGDGRAQARMGRTPSSAFVVAEFEGIRLPDHPGHLAPTQLGRREAVEHHQNRQLQGANHEPSVRYTSSVFGSEELNQRGGDNCGLHIVGLAG
jgi:hypothetical protein